jgi:major membrane immunogen (membrane-anchored lipoprotein)
MFRVLDGKPYIAVKEVVLARSGVYKYTYEDMIARGHVPKIKKDYYTEYRPKEIFMQNKDKFAFITASVEHTEDQTDKYNFHDEGQVCGVVGDTIRIEPLPDGEVAVVGQLALYTQDAVDYLNKGHKETSADYGSRAVVSSDPRYDFQMVALGDVNSVAITSAGRGGPLVRVRDSVRRAALRANQNPLKKHGGFDMDWEKLLKLLGITRTTDSNNKFSKVVFDALKNASKVDRTKNGGADYEAALNEGRKKIAGELTRVTDSVGRTQLATMVNTVLGVPESELTDEVQAKVSEGLDKLYDKYRTKDEDTLQRTMDELMGNKKEETEEEKAARLKKEGESRTTDAAAGATVGYVDQKFKELAESLPDLLAAGVAKLAGVSLPEGGDKTRVTDSKKTAAEKLQAQLDLLTGGEGDSRTTDNETVGDEAFELLHVF